MGGFGGDLTRTGQTNSMFGKNIDAKYRAPKDARLFGIEINQAEVLSIESLLARIPENYIEEQTKVTGDRWKEGFDYFSGKDGQTNAYVKRGLDFELSEIVDGFEAPVLVWHFATDDTSIDFQLSGKVYTMGREWTIIKIINQYSRGTTINKFYAMNTLDNAYGQMVGYKTFVMV